MKNRPDPSRDILDAALSLFARYGFKRTSVEEIATKARVGKGTVYLYFASKEELLVAVIRRGLDEVYAAIVRATNAATTPAGKLRAYVHTRVAEARRIVREVRPADGAVVEVFPTVREVQAEHHERELALLEGILNQGIQSGAFETPQPRLLATGILAWLHGLEFTILMLKDPPEMDDALDTMLLVTLRGLLPQPHIR